MLKVRKYDYLRLIAESEIMEKVQGVYHRKDGRWEARYKKGVGSNGRAIYGAVYGENREEVIQRRDKIIREISYKPTELNLLILGAGSHGHDVKEIAEALHIFHTIAFLDDNVVGEGIIGKCKDVQEFHNRFSCAFVAIGDNEKRKEYAELLKNNRFLIPKLISQSAVISPNAEIGDGTAVLAQATIGAAEIGEFCIISQNSSINSDVIVNSYSHVGSGGIIERGSVLAEKTVVKTGEVILN